MKAVASLQVEGLRGCRCLSNMILQVASLEVKGLLDASSSMILQVASLQVASLQVEWFRGCRDAAT